MQSRPAANDLPMNCYTNLTSPDEKEPEHTFSTVHGTAQNAACTGTRYARENQIPIILGAVLVGAVLGACLAPKRHKKPDAVQIVRDWLEKTLEQISEQWPKAKKQTRSIQDELARRLRV
jgi:hypothetical protein